ncbi:MAG: hypothetical protein ABIJ31_02045 [Pseudomonadota bacterium]
MKTNRFLLKTFFLWCFLVLIGFAGYASAAVTVWVQPSGPDIQSAYTLVGEARTYFGRTEGGAGTYEAMWQFSDGTVTAWAGIGDPNDIAIVHTFASSGLNWARLSVRDAANPTDLNHATVQVQTLATDSTNRQKNSAIDRGLRKHYLDQVRTAEGSYWGSNRVGETSMAMIAFENHGHNLEAPASDIYLKTVREGIRYIMNRAEIVDLSVQACIGDPEGVPGDPAYDDLDTDNDGIGITFYWGQEGYESPLAMLAIVNSCKLATAQTLLATEGPLSGMSFFDIMVDAKDFLAYAQTDFEGTGNEGGEGEDSCAPTNTEWAYGSTSDPDLLTTKFFQPWRSWTGWNPPGTVGAPAVVHLIAEDRYFDITFNFWQSGGDPTAGTTGGFAYTRATGDTYVEPEGAGGPKIWTGSTISFTKPDGADWTDPANQDTIVPGTTITRQDDQGIFNININEGYNATSPENTEWASGTTADEDLLTKTYANWNTWARSIGQTPDIVNVPAVVHLIAEDIYLDIMFTAWTSGGNTTYGGGGFTYTRTTINPSSPDEQIFTGPSITFNKPNFSDWTDPANQDTIVPGTTITRQDNQGIFNIDASPDFDSNPCGLQEPLECIMAGWRYDRNDSSIDNSVAQWPTLALEEAKTRWNINVNPQVVELFKGWLSYSQDGSGGFGYSSPGDWVNFPKTGAGLAMLKWAGFTSADVNVQAALAYLDTNWANTCYDGNLGSFYGMYAFYKGMKFLGLTTTPAGTAWEDVYTSYLISNQNPDGSWNSCDGWIPDPMNTGTALAMLAPAVAGLPPVAEAGGPYGPVNANQVVYLDGSGSFHQDGTKNLISYDWDFDVSDGLWWDSAAFPAPGQGAVGIITQVSYPDTGSDATYTATLRITDDSTPAMIDTDTATITVTSGNVAPDAVTNGPWAGIPGVPIIFDGTGSTDPNSCTTSGDPSCLADSIVSYEWDLDGDGLYNETNGEDGMPVTPNDWSIVTKTYSTPTSGLAALRVTDSYGLQDSAVNQILSIAVAYATRYNYCLVQRTGRFTYNDFLTVEFTNIGNQVAQNLVVTLTSVPTDRTIVSGVSSLGDLAPGSSAFTACDPNVPAADIQLTRNVRINPTGTWSWQAEFDFNGQHYIIPNMPPLAP